MREMISLKDLIGKVRSYSPDADLGVLKSAYHFSREAHCSQKRSEGSPYIKHPLAVASILADMKMDVCTAPDSTAMIELATAQSMSLCT